jgi:plasmid stabilization system protein ParE
VKYRIIVRRLAERDLEDAEDWYNGQQPGLGTEFRDTITDLFGRLAENPRIYPRVYGDVHRAVLRRFPYLVYFLIDDSEVIVLTVLDSRRDPHIHRERSGA